MGSGGTPSEEKNELPYCTIPKLHVRACSRGIKSAYRIVLRNNIVFMNLDQTTLDHSGHRIFEHRFKKVFDREGDEIAAIIGINNIIIALN